MRRGLLLALLAAPAAAQYTAEPQYQLTGKNYSSEAPAIQQMFYNTTSGIQRLQSEINAIVIPPSGVTKIVAGTNVTISPAGGTGSVTINSSGAGTDFGPSTAALSIRLDSVAVATTTLSASTAALSVRLGSVASSTTTLSASTAALSVRLDSVAVATTTLAGIVSTLGQSTNTFSIWQGTTSIWMTASAASTTSLNNLKLSSPTVAGAVGDSLTIGSNGLPAWAAVSSSGGSSTMTITAVSDNFISQITGSLKTFTLSNTPANASALSCYLDGLLLSQTSDYIYTPPSTVAVTTAPAANSTEFLCNYFVNTSTLPAVFILNSSQTVSGSNTNTGLWTDTVVSSAATLGMANYFHRVYFSSGLAVSNFTADNTTQGSQFFGSTASYHVEINIWQNTSTGIHTIQFNGDTGSNYNYAMTGSRTVSGPDPLQATGATSCRIDGSNAAIAGTGSSFNLWISPHIHANGYYTMQGFYTFDDASSPGSGGAVECFYNGSAPITSIKVTTSGGTMDYRIRIERNDW